ncbi:hypothetical protein Tco_0473721, partial [Tanacetum coccineum]
GSLQALIPLVDLASQSQILGDLVSPVLTRSRAQKSKFGESAFIGYIQDQRKDQSYRATSLSVCLLPFC